MFDGETTKAPVTTGESKKVKKDVPLPLPFSNLQISRPSKMIMQEPHPHLTVDGRVSRETPIFKANSSITACLNTNFLKEIEIKAFEPPPCQTER